jgi:hypothetical protein
MYDNRPIAAWIKELETFRFCCACGQVNIPREKPSYVTKCENCYQRFQDTKGKGKTHYRNIGTALKPEFEEWKESSDGMNKFCGECGEELEQYRIDYALSQTKQGAYMNECKRCEECAKHYRKPCEKCGKFHPRNWTDSPNHP